MGAQALRIESKRELPDYLPARMVNEFTYCPRLFFYEWVEGLFAESVDTIEGAIQHKRVDAKASALPATAQPEADIHARSVTLSSERLRVIAKMDLVEIEGGFVTPVDYKHGHPREARWNRSTGAWALTCCIFWARWRLYSGSGVCH